MGSMSSRFLTGCLAPLLVAAGVLAWRGDVVADGVNALGPSGTLAAVIAFVLTLVIPCGRLALPGGGAGLTSRFARGLVPPLAILACGGLAHPETPRDAGADDRGLAVRAVELVWCPLGVETPGETLPEAEAPVPEEEQDETEALRRRIADLQRECEVAREALEALRAADTPDLTQEVEEQRARIAAMEKAEIERAEAAKRAAEEHAALSESHLKALSDLTAARKEGEELRAEILVLKERVQMARDDAALAERKLRARIEELETSGSAAALKKLRASSFVRVGVVLHVHERAAGGGIRVKTNADSRGVSGLAFVLDPRGKPIGVLSLGVGYGDEIDGRILFTAPASKPTPGDSVYARIR
jgi:rRNA maturation endonuclease Nob1